MIVEELAALIQLAEIPSRSPEKREAAKLHMVKLREAGFTNQEISTMTGKEWSARTVKQYTAGAKITNKDERDKALQTLSKLAASGKSLEDVDHFLEVDAKLRAPARETSIDEVLELDKKAADSITTIPALADLHAKMTSSGHSVENLSKSIDTLTILYSKGFTGVILEKFKQIVENYGDLEKTLQAMSTYLDLQLLKEKCAEYKNRYEEAKLSVDQETVKKNNIINEGRTYQTYVDMAKTLINDYGFDLKSLGILMTTAKKFGRPPEIFEALNSYNTLSEITSQIEAAKLSLKKHKDEADKKQNELNIINEFLDGARRDLGRLDAEMDGVWALQTLSSMLENPNRLKLSKQDFLKVSSAIIGGISKSLAENPSLTGDWNKSIKWRLDGALDSIAKEMQPV